MEQPQSVPPDVREEARQRMRQVRENLAVPHPEAALKVFVELHPADQAELLLDLDQEQQQDVLKALSSEASAGILEHMKPEDAAGVFGEMEAPALSEILDEAPPHVAADLLKQLPEDQFQEALRGMEDVEGVTPLLEYADESAGGLMTPEFVSVRDDMTAAIALDRLRILGPKAEDIGYLVIVDEEGKLLGSLSVTRLALARPATPVGEIMNPDVVYVTAGTDQEECAHLMERYNLGYIPVVDEEQKLVGVILVDDLVDVLEQEATEDMYNMTGIGGERLFGPLASSIRRRLPWLYLNLATTVLAALVVSAFEDTIVKVVALAVFLPVVAGQGGIGGTQTLTLVIRGIALGDIPGHRASRLLVREMLLGLIHGLLLGVVIGLLAYWWKGNVMLGVVLGVAMVGNMVVAGLAGSSVPLVLRLFRLDPALGSAVVVTTVTDVVGFSLFLGFATIVVSTLL